MFYPQLVAGPIERPQHLLHQFYETHAFEYERIKMGLLRMAWGFFKKMVVADRLALVVNTIFLHPTQYKGLTLIVASVFFTLELYFDFSAYCDIALGAARVMGFTLVENFNRPFTARSIAEFWRKWHISLSSWFRDYFFYPLTMSRREITRAGIYASLLLTFVVTGFWHGANWTYGIFGLLHGSYIVLGEATKKSRDAFLSTIGLTRVPRLHAVLQMTIVFLLMTLSCIFFRASSATDAFYIVENLFSGTGRIFSAAYFHDFLANIGISSKAFLFTCILTVIVFTAENSALPPWIRIASLPSYIRWPIYWVMIFAIIVLNESGSSQFIYFQF